MASSASEPPGTGPPRKSQPTSNTVIGAGAQLTLGLSSRLAASLSSPTRSVPQLPAHLAGAESPPADKGPAGLGPAKAGGSVLVPSGVGGQGQQATPCQAAPTFTLSARSGGRRERPSSSSRRRTLAAPCCLQTLPPSPPPPLSSPPSLHPPPPRSRLVARTCHPPESSLAGCRLNSCSSSERPRGSPDTPSPLGRQKHLLQRLSRLLAPSASAAHPAAAAAEPAAAPGSPPRGYTGVTQPRGGCCVAPH